MSTDKELQRIEAFSDGVFAIACTLLILEIKVPHIENVSKPGILWPALKSVWPSLLAYVLSFGSILVAWAGHHRAVGALTGSSKVFLYANGFLLLTITFMPFPTAVLAEYIDTPQSNIAVMFYSASWTVISLAFNVWWLTMLRPVRLIPSSVTNSAIRTGTIQLIAGLTLYAATTALSYWFPLVGLFIIAAVQILWIVMTLGENRVET